MKRGAEFYCLLAFFIASLALLTVLDPLIPVHLFYDACGGFCCPESFQALFLLGNMGTRLSDDDCFCFALISILNYMGTRLSTFTYCVLGHLLGYMGKRLSVSHDVCPSLHFLLSSSNG